MSFNLMTLLGLAGQNPQGNIPESMPEQSGPDITVNRPEPHKGMFGIKGTARDILGTLGDAFLTQAGKDPIYRPQRQSEKQSDALGSDFYENPMNAVQRLSEAGFGKEAVALQKQIEEQQINKARYQSEDEYRKAQITDKGQGIISNYLAAIKDDGSYQKALPGIQAMAQRYGVDTSTLPQTYDDSVKRWGIPAYQQNRLDDFDTEQKLRETNVSDQIRHRKASEGISIRGQDISAATSRANNAASVGAAIRGQDMTDKRVRESAGFSGKGSRRSAPPPPPASGSSSGKYVLRNGKFVKQ